MPFKPHESARALPALSGMSVLELSGPGAAAFAQAQFMNDVLALVPGRWQWNGWLTPKGRVIALFALARLAEDRLWAVLPDLPAEEFAVRLQRFVFRAKVRLAALGDHKVAADFEPGIASSEANALTGSVEEGLALDLSAAGGARRWLLLPAGHARLADADVSADARWLAADLAHGLPRLAGDQVEAWTPQMLSLERLRAYSVKKGCYPGQEIVARTHFLGQAKRALVRLSGVELAVGLEVRADDRTLGHIVCTNGQEALAVIAAEHPRENLGAGGRPCRELPLLEGLAR